MLDLESFLSDDLRARLRAPVDLGAGARARVMQRVRAAAMVSRVAPGPRGITRPSVLGALLAASFVAAILTSVPGGTTANGGRMTLADTIAMHLSPMPDSMVPPPVIDRERLVAVADETRNPAPGAFAAVPAAPAATTAGIRRD